MQLRLTGAGACASSYCDYRFLRRDALDSGFSSEQFDCAIASFMIDDCVDHDRLLRETHRVLKPRGLFLLSGHHLDFECSLAPFVHNFADGHWLTGNPASLVSAVALARQAGFEIVESSQLRHAWLAVLRK